MRIVVTTTSYPRTSDDPSGHFVWSSARARAAAGDEVHVIAPGGSPFDPPRRESGVTVHPAGGGALFAWPGALARAKEAPWRVLDAGPFAAGVLARLRAIGPVDRAIAHWIIPSAFPLLLATKAPLDVHAHGADVRLLLDLPRPLRQEVLRALLDRGARFTFAAGASLTALELAVSSDLAAALRRVAHVDPPPIDMPDVGALGRELRASLDLAPGERAVVTVCRLIASKRVDLAIEAIARAGEGLLLVVVGDGPERAALEKLAADRGARVRFVGALHRREAIGWMAAADMLLHPSAVEAAPTVIREARALRVPVVACDAGDVVAWARDDEGIRVVAADADAIAGALRAIASRRSGAPS